MTNKTARGEKRKCQNEECISSFYDLNREEFHCPVCGTTFDHDAHAAAIAQQQAAVPNYIRRRQQRKLPIVAIENAFQDGAIDNDATDNNDSGDGEEVADNEAAVAEAADALLEQDDATSDPLPTAIPLSVADDEGR